MIKTVYENVLFLMGEFPIFKEDEMQLILGYYHQIVGIDPDKTTVIDLFRAIKAGAPSVDTITRAARKVREEHPELRPKNYEARLAHQEEVIREIKSI